MANFLASIFGTEQDKVNCSFYYKIGACRHGDRCSRKHVKPAYSQTILMTNLYQNPAYEPNPAASTSGGGGGGPGTASHIRSNRMNAAQLQNHFDAFYEDIWCELCKYGELEELVVCDNNNDHLIGNVYARYKYEECAAEACNELNGRWYAGRPIYCELSPVTDFREACCRLNSNDGDGRDSRDGRGGGGGGGGGGGSSGSGCARGGFCNFIHRKDPSPDLDHELQLATKKYLKERGRDPRSVSRL